MRDSISFPRIFLTSCEVGNLTSNLSIERQPLYNFLYILVVVLFFTSLTGLETGLPAF